MEIALAIVTLALVAIAFTNEYFQQKLGVSMMPSMPKVKRAMVGLIPQDTTGEIIELGSGWGGMAIAAARAFPACRVTGIEYSLVPYVAARLRNRLPNLRFERKNFFDVPLARASVVLCYLSNPLMARLRQKFVTELRAGATMISSTFFVPDWEPVSIVDIKGLWSTRIFVYRVEKEKTL